MYECLNEEEQRCLKPALYKNSVSCPATLVGRGDFLKRHCSFSKSLPTRVGYAKETMLTPESIRSLLIKLIALEYQESIQWD
jgi:hypothetical protein